MIIAWLVSLMLQWCQLWDPCLALVYFNITMVLAVGTGFNFDIWGYLHYCNGCHCPVSIFFYKCYCISLYFRFHVILDTQGPQCYQACFNLCASGGNVITLVTSLESTIDKHGLIWGATKANWARLAKGIKQVGSVVGTKVGCATQGVQRYCKKYYSHKSCGTYHKLLYYVVWCFKNPLLFLHV